MNDTTQWFFGKRENLLVFSGTVETILTQDTQIVSSELVIAVFPEFHHVAVFSLVFRVTGKSVF